ncbi:unnamed protein product [Tetraodon nigroviridis]|uniref:Chromosome 13 SCAF14555, whole genome shotgun sequence n=1 Tax=Tetraodon nigroviridis TaxID=99883 RepID=Q4SLT9_TETNG|nr:unnamed protein product [Tetraodon nigroviridis]
MALTSPVTGKAVSFANLNQPVDLLSLNAGRNTFITQQG